MANSRFTLESTYLSVHLYLVNGEVVSQDYPADMHPSDCVYELMDQCALDPDFVSSYSTVLQKHYVKRKKLLNYGNL